MYLKANYEKIEGVGISVLKETEQLENALKEMLALLESIPSCWGGPDSANFVNNSSTYIRNLDANVSELSNLGDYIKRVAFTYGSKDVEWKNKVRKVGVIDEQLARN